MGDSLRIRDQADFTPRGQETGTYTVNPDCTGSMVINLNVPNTPPPHGVIKTVFVISDGGRHLHDVVSEFIPPGFTEPPPLKLVLTIGRSHRTRTIEALERDFSGNRQ